MRRTGQRSEKAANSDIAIVGMACRFPGAADYECFWRNLVNEVNAITEVPADRWSIDQYYSPNAGTPGRSNSKWGGFLEQVDAFDNRFFNISPREAKNLDPQQRLLLEEAWHCLEDAGIPLGDLRAQRTAVYVGATAIDHYQDILDPGVNTDSYACSGTYVCILANRISHYLGLRGPSLAIDTACSSSLVAMHQACQSLLAGESDFAMVAGITLVFNPWKYISLSKARMLSPDGQCKTFDKDANGYVPGEGVGVLLLQPLERALVDGNQIYAILKGSAVNHGGHSLSLTAPRVEAQRDVLLEAYEDAGVNPETITYLEAHGTGTSLGDPIEVEALTRAFRRHTSAKQFCLIGAVKTSIGHLEAAAGIAGVIKVLLMMKHRVIPKSLNIKTLNPMIDFPNSPFRIADRQSSWDYPGGHPRRAGVSSFGFGGVNCHVVLEECPENWSSSHRAKKLTGEAVSEHYPFILSAKTDVSLTRLLRNWAGYVDSADFCQLKMADVCRTLMVGREHFQCRFGGCVGSKTELKKVLEAAAVDEYSVDATHTWVLRVGGVSGIHPALLSPVYQSQSQFRLDFDQCEQEFLRITGDREALQGIRTGGPIGDEYQRGFDFAVLYSLSRQFMALAARPEFIGADLGGHLVALCMSGMISLRQALPMLLQPQDAGPLSIERPQTPVYDPVHGIMLSAVRMSPGYLNDLVKEVTVDHSLLQALVGQATLLAESQHTFRKYLEEWNECLGQEGLDIFQLLKTGARPIGDEVLPSHRLLLLLIASHSLRKLSTKWNLSERFPVGDTHLAELLDLLSDEVLVPAEIVSLLIRENEGVVAVACTANARLNRIDLSKPYSHLRAFCRQVEEITQPNEWLDQISRRSLPEGVTAGKLTLFVGSTNHDTPAQNQIDLSIDGDLEGNINESLVRLWRAGIEIDWAKYVGSKPFNKVALPTYEFVRERFCIRDRTGGLAQGEKAEQNRIASVGDRQPKIESLESGPSWPSPSTHRPSVDANVSTEKKKEDETRFHPDESPFPSKTLHPLIDNVVPSLKGAAFRKLLCPIEPIVRDHVVNNQPMFPGVGHLEMALAAGNTLNQGSVSKLKDVVWLTPLTVDPNGIDVRVILQETPNDVTFAVTSNLITYSTGKLILRRNGKQQPVDWIDLKTVQSNSIRQLQKQDVYALYAKRGISYGPYFQVIEKVWANDKEALGKICTSPIEEPGYTLHPALMDGAFQTSIGLLTNKQNATEPLVPFSVEEIEIFESVTSARYAYLKAASVNFRDDALRFDMALLDEKGQVLVKMKNVYLKAAKSEVRRSLTAPNPLTFCKPRWRQEAGHEVGRSGAGTILIFRHQNDFGLAGKLALAHSSQPVLTVYLGRKYDQLSDGQVAIDCSQQADFDRLLSQQKGLDTIYFLGGLELPAAEITDLETLNQTQELGVLSLFRLIKALGPDPVVVLKVITNDVYNIVQADTALYPYGSSLIGLSKVIARECPRSSVSCVDIARRAPDAILEILGESALESAIRDNRRHVRVIDTVQLETKGAVPLKKKGVYLIIGGAGGIGLEVSQYLAAKTQARLVLVGRRELEDTQREKIGQIEAQGGEVLYCRADATDLTAMQNVVKAAKEKYGVIDGAIHSALVLADRSIARMDESTFRAGLAPKVQGSFVLAEVLKEEPLDFILFFSSAISFIGNSGQSNYAAGCSFKDAYGLYLVHSRNRPAKVINWGYWGEVGVVANEFYRQRLAQQGIYPLTREEGIAAFEQILASPTEQIMPIKADRSILERIGLDSNYRLLAPEPNYRSIFEEVTVRVKDFLACQGDSFNPSAEGAKGLDDFCRLRLLKAFMEAGALQSGSQTLRKAELRTRLRLLSKHSRLLEALLDILAKGKFIELSGDVIAVSKKVESPEVLESLASLESAKERLKDLYPDSEPHLILLEHCAGHLMDILSGRMLATDLLFPNSSPHLVERVYRGNKRQDYFNNLVAEAVRRAVQGRVGSLGRTDKVRILEVGAGIGGTSVFILEAIQQYAEHLEYYYSDVSPAFTQYGRRTYGAKHSFMQFEVLDIEREVEGQNLGAAAYDIVVAANVIHATRAVHNTLAQLKKLLKANGLLILQEVTKVQAFLTLTFGLLDGWWSFEDGEKRLQNAPLLGVPDWIRCLHEEGFKAQAFGEPRQTEGVEFAQSVLVAESNGLVKLTRNRLSDPQAKGHPRLPARMPAHVPARDTEKNDLRVFIVERIRERAASSLGMNGADLDENETFSDVGVDSILAAEIVHKINVLLNLDLRTTIIFDYVTIADLAGHILQEHEGSVKKAREATEKTAPGRTDGPFDSRDSKTLDHQTRPDGQLFASGQEHLSGAPPPLRPENVSSAEVAIIGLSCRFPGARNADEFWHLLATGKDSISEVPPDRWDVKEFYHPDPLQPNKTYSKWGGFLEGIEEFDASFFNISGTEAEMMDPQQRLFLQECWKAVEDAGYSHRQLSQTKCAVFVGVSASDYQQKLMEEGVSLDGHVFTGNQASILSARIAYCLNLKGPAMAIDTACSSSLVAVHLGCQSVLRGESHMALAGGVFINTTPTFHILSSKAGMLSPAGRCKAFDNDADGFVPSEGVGVVLLKALERAIAEGDHIYAIIKASGINQDGKTNGITAPSSLSQTQLELEVYEKAGINPATISYVEAHGTGTKLGDPIEIEALTNAFRKYTDRKSFCALGSVKTNIGHAGTAAGIAGLAKVLLSLKHNQVPPSLNFNRENEHLNLKTSPFYVNTQLREWQCGPYERRRAAVSSFGFSGTNCHLVIEEAPTLPLPDQEPQPYYLVALSARSEDALDRRKKDLAEWLLRNAHSCNVADLSYTLNAGRSHFEERAAYVVESLNDLGQRLGDVPQTDSNTHRLQLDADADRLIAEISVSLPPHIYQDKLLALAGLYRRGADLNWEALYRTKCFRRTSLPTYPFSCESHGISAQHHSRQRASEFPNQRLHPLIDTNESTLKEGRFTKVFCGNESYVKDHVILNQKLVPGMVLLEMARAAGQLAGESPVASIRNNVWIAPLPVDGKPRKLSVRLSASQRGVDYEISSNGIVGEQGTICREGASQQSSSLDLGEIRRRCLWTRTGKEVYALFHSLGIVYGPSFQTIRELCSNKEEALAWLHLPDDLSQEFQAFGLHPSLLDGALQAAAGIIHQRGISDRVPFVPYSVAAVEIRAPLTPDCYAFVTAHTTRPDLLKFDISLVNQAGQTAVQLTDLAIRPMKRPEAERTSTFYYQPGRERAGLPELARSPDRLIVFDRDEAPLPELAASEFFAKSQKYLGNLLAVELKVPDTALKPYEAFERYGIDSMIISRLNMRLEKEFGTISKTLFFEYQNLKELTTYFVENHAGKLVELLRLGGQATPRADVDQLPQESQLKSSLESTPVTLSRFVKPHRNNSEDSDIAIVGMSGRFPQANNLATFWENLRTGRDCITEIPKERWDYRHFFNPDKTQEGHCYSKWGGFIEDFDKFDPRFFKISPQEAELIDPQERVFLEVVFETLEDAGYTREKLRAVAYDPRGRDVGVFVGVMWGDYQLYAVEASSKRNGNAPWSAYWSIANRVSYFCDFQGPSMAVDTACSSSLVAIHMACESIQRGHCRAAIAGGVNLSIHPNKYLLLSQLKFASSDGRCRSFGEGGDGYVPGEGVGAILLKPLAAAIADRDQIHAVIKAVSINHGGKTNGYSVPNPNAQANLIADALERAGVEARTLTYLEAHGTGTALGDPIEITGLTKAFRESTQDKQFCAVGSVKSNIGHLESAAGIAGVIKVLLQMKHRELVPSLHSERTNQNINFTDTPFYVQRKLSEWTQPVMEGGEYPRRAGVSSFGAGGANAHIVLEEYEDPRPPSVGQAPELIVLSAKNQERLKDQVRNLKNFLEAEAPPALADIAYTLQVGREGMDVRLALIVEDKAELRQRLSDILDEKGHFENVFRGNFNVDSVFERDPEDLAYLDAITKNRKLAKIAKRWVDGAEIDWDLLGLAEGRKRISLPTYPFARERHWIPQKNVTMSPPQAYAHPRQVNIRPDIYYQLNWQEAALSPAISGSNAEIGGTLVFAREQSLLDAWRKRLSPSNSGTPLIFVRPSGTYEFHHDGICNIRPEIEEDYIRLLKDLNERGIKPNNVVHLWNYQAEPIDFDSEPHALCSTLKNRMGAGIYTAFYLTKALQGIHYHENINLLYLFRATETNAQPQDVAVSAFARTVRLETPNYRYKTIQLEDPEDQGSDLIQIIFSELLSGQEDVEIRYCNGRRWVRTVGIFQPGNLGQNDVEPPLRDRGVYLITGGLGELGFIFSKFLAENYRSRLILTGRSELNTEKRKRIEEIEALGGEVIYVPADIGNPEQMEHIVRKGHERFGTFNGVLHAACVIDDGLLYRKESSSFKTVLHPKVTGTVLLDQATRHEALDFFVLFSSVASVVGNAGQGDYATACRFQDSFAELRGSLRQHGARSGKTLSISWPQWKHASHFASRQLLDAVGMKMLDEETGWGAFQLGLLSNQAFLMVIDGNQEKIHNFLQIDKGNGFIQAPLKPIQKERKLASHHMELIPDLEALSEDEIDHYLSRLLSEADASTLASISPLLGHRRDTEPPLLQPAARDTEAMQEVIATVLVLKLKLKLQPGDFERPFTDFGLDSVKAIKIADEIQERLGVDVNPRMLWEHPSIKDLAKRLSDESTRARVKARAASSQK